MTQRKKSDFLKMLTVALVIAFGITFLAIGLKALSSSTDIRSRAAKLRPTPTPYRLKPKSSPTPTRAPSTAYCTQGQTFCGSTNSVDYNVIFTCVHTKTVGGSTQITWKPTPCPPGTRCVKGSARPTCVSISQPQ